MGRPFLSVEISVFNSEEYKSKMGERGQVDISERGVMPGDDEAPPIYRGDQMACVECTVATSLTWDGDPMCEDCIDDAEAAESAAEGTIYLEE